MTLRLPLLDGGQPWWLPSWAAYWILGICGACACIAAFAFLPELHEGDMRLAAWLGARERITLSDSIVLVDVSKGKDIIEFRRNLGALLKELAADPGDLPRLVALDLWFDAEIPGQETVAEGIDALHHQRHPVPVHGVLNVREESGQLAVDETARHLLDLYERMDSVGHNLIAKGPAGPFYQPCLASGRVAMPILVAAPSLADSAAGLPPRLIPMGLPLERANAPQILSYAARQDRPFQGFGGDALATRPSFYNKIVLVGRLREDRSPYPERSGPEVVAWAINDLLGGSGAATVLDSPSIHAGLAVLMPLVALLFFAGMLRYLHAWRLRPWRIAFLAGAGALLVPLALMLVVRATGHHYCQVLLPTLLTVWALFLATRRRCATIQESEQNRRRNGVQEHVAYDVFISYRRTHADWVRRHLLPALRDLKHADGSPWRIFWDNQDLHSGNFNRQLEWAIHESRVFLPLLTPDYFDPDKRYCYWEMGTAYDRIPLGALRMILLFHAGYDPAQHGHRDFPSLAAMHGYDTADPALFEKLRRDLQAIDAEA